MFHHQPTENSAVAASLAGHDQCDRESAVGRADANAPGVPLARCLDGGPLGSRLVPGYREELPPHHGLEGSLWQPEAILGRKRNEDAATMQEVG